MGFSARTVPRGTARPRFAHRQAVLGSQVSLIVASLSLAEVRLVRGAILAADIQSVKSGRGREVEPVIEPRRRFHPDPIIEPRIHVHPSPKVEPRPLLRPLPRIDPGPCCHCATDEGAAIVPAAPAPELLSPLQPPWKVLPWEEPRKPAPMIKVTVYRSDVIHKGSLFDFFI